MTNPLHILPIKYYEIGCISGLAITCSSRTSDIVKFSLFQISNYKTETLHEYGTQQQKTNETKRFGIWWRNKPANCSVYHKTSDLGEPYIYIQLLQSVICHLFGFSLMLFPWLAEIFLRHELSIRKRTWKTLEFWSNIYRKTIRVHL